MPTGIPFYIGFNANIAQHSLASGEVGPRIRTPLTTFGFSSAPRLIAGHCSPRSNLEQTEITVVNLETIEG